ncbi:MAG: flagellar biosynthesis regulator FlaF [Nitrospirae bacterium]|nr:flagellar biosynthesis regulator FlaF [Nitrospirota bacterium]
MPVNNPFSAYQEVAKKTLDGPALEAYVLNRAAQLLIECKNQWNESGHQERLDKALGYNQKLWTFFQVELANPEHSLPKKIREDILSLSIFIDKRIYEVITEPDPGKLEVMININRNIANGLQGNAIGS